MTAKIYAFANQKGGVAKTTTSVNLGAYVAAKGRRVLIVDLDPQANATTSLGINPRQLSKSIYNMLIEDLPVQDVLTLTDRLGLDLLPSTTDLAGAEIELARMMARERLLSRALDPVLERYDYIFIDEPPSLGLLTINGLTSATHGVMIPVQCEYLALEGLSLLLQTVQQVRDILNSRLTIAGVVLTMYDGRTNISQQVVQEVRTYFPDQIFQTIIPRNVRLSEAPSHGKTILGYAPQSAGALAYDALSTEFLTRVEGAPPESLTSTPAGSSTGKRSG
jgi:chromosome partitioning protein